MPERDKQQDDQLGYNPGGPDPELIPDAFSNAELHLAEEKRIEAMVDVDQQKVRAARERRLASEGPVDETTPEKVEEARRTPPVNRSATPPARQTAATESKDKK